MNAVFFDLDGTLIDYKISFEELYNTALRELDVEPSGKAAFSKAFFDVLGEVDDPFAAAITQAEVDVNPTAFSDTLVRAEIEHTHEKAGVRSLLYALDGTYSLGILTNGVGRVQRAKLDAMGLTDWFDAIVISSEVGAQKPEPGIFRAAENILPADDYVFIADSLDRDVRPAVECGWHGIFFGDESPADVVDVQRLADVSDVLDRREWSF